MSAKKSAGIFKKAVVVAVALAVGVALGAWWESRRAAAPGEEAAHEEAQPALYTCPMHPAVVQEEPGQCPICGMNLVPLARPGAAAQKPEAKAEVQAAAETGKKKGKKILYWVAPMDPTFISDKPGKSPMGMDLVPVYEGEEPGMGRTLKIDPSVVQNIGVRSEVAEEGTLTRTIRAVGYFEVNEETLASVNTKFSGWVERLYVNQTGQEVEKGQPLLTIYSPELVSTQEEYLSALRYLESVKDSPFQEVKDSARSLVRAAERRLAYWDISGDQIKILARTGRVKKTLTLHSPVTGIVMHKNAVEGLEVKPGEDLFRIADLRTLWLQARIYEKDTPWVKEGDRAVVKVDYLPGRVFSGTVDYIYPYLNAMTRDITARIVVENPGLELKPGMFATVELKYQAPPSVIIPDEAVIRTGERDVVFIDLGEGRFAPREVTLGLFGDGRMVQVIKGVRRGEKVVTSAQFLLDSESTIQEAIKKMLMAKGLISGGEEKDSMKPAGEMKAQKPAEKAMKHEPGDEHEMKMEEPERGGGSGSGHEHKHSGMESMRHEPLPEAEPTNTEGSGGRESMHHHPASQTLYTCPMEEHQDVLSEEPGECPRCGMKLVPVDEVEYDHPLKRNSRE